MKHRRFFFHEIKIEVSTQIDGRLFDLLVGMLGRVTLTQPVRSRMIAVINKDLVDRGEFDDAVEAYLEACVIVEAMGNALLERGSFDGDINIIPGHYDRDGKCHTFTKDHHHPEWKDDRD